MATLRSTPEITSKTTISGKPRLITSLAKLTVLAGFAVIFLVATSAPSSAETRTFSYPKWAGAIVDNCVTWATNCDGGGAQNFCRLKGYSRASRWRIYRPGRTYVIGSRRYCNGGICGGYSSVTCTRSGGGGGGSANFCNNYARTAINQQRRNLNRRCGYSGNRWQLNYSNHYNWCQRVSRSSANSETNARNSGLRSCRGGPARTRTFSYPRWAGAIVDNCVTWATNCGGGGAQNFCRLKGYGRASRWRIYRPGRTYVIGSRRYCNGNICGGYSSVTCVAR